MIPSPACPTGEASRWSWSVKRHGSAATGRRGPSWSLTSTTSRVINDTLGHNAGDQLIISMATVLRSSLRETDIVARLGGDEFAAILPYVTLSEAEVVAANLLNEIRSKVTLLSGEKSRQVTASVGWRSSMTPGSRARKCWSTPTSACTTPRRPVGTAAPSTGRTATTSLAPRRSSCGWTASTPRSTTTDLLWLQPILDLGTGPIDRHEVLLRMMGPAGDIGAPGAFLYVAGRMGLIGGIDHWVIDHSIGLWPSTQVFASRSTSPA